MVEDMEVNKEDMTEGLQEEEEEERMQALRLGKEERRAKEAQLSHQQQVGQQNYVHAELVMGSKFISISKLPKNLPHQFNKPLAIGTTTDRHSYASWKVGGVSRTSNQINQKRRKQKTDYENLILLQKIQNVKPSRSVMTSFAY